MAHAECTWVQSFLVQPLGAEARKAGALGRHVLKMGRRMLADTAALPARFHLLRTSWPIWAKPDSCVPSGAKYGIGQGHGAERPRDPSLGPFT